MLVEWPNPCDTSREKAGLLGAGCSGWWLLLLVPGAAQDQRAMVVEDHIRYYT